MIGGGSELARGRTLLSQRIPVGFHLLAWIFILRAAFRLTPLHKKPGHGELSDPKASPTVPTPLNPHCPFA